MGKKNKEETENKPAIPAELAAFRRQIDAIDDKLIALLTDRIGIIAEVGKWKRREYPGECPIRAGREAVMVRRVVQAFAGSGFSQSAAAAMWRTLIGASTSIEGALKLSVFAPEENEALYWLGREYFGSFIPSIKQPHVKRVIGDVMDGKASVGIVPPLRDADTSYWWTNLMQPGGNTPKIFAHIPFVYEGAPNREMPAGLAIACIEPEPTGDDVSLFVFEAEHNVSQTKLQAAFTEAALEANWISVAALSPQSRHHLIEVKAFATLSHPATKSIVAALGASLLHVNFLGAYAAPVILPANAQPHESISRHAARPHKT